VPVLTLGWTEVVVVVLVRDRDRLEPLLATTPGTTAIVVVAAGATAVVVVAELVAAGAANWLAASLGAGVAGPACEAAKPLPAVALAVWATAVPTSSKSG